MRRLVARFRPALSPLGIASLAVGILLVTVALSVFAALFPEWTGLPGDPLPPGAAATPVVVYEQPRDLWDWLQLLFVPGALLVGGYFLTRAENRHALKLQTRRESEQALQAYFKQMTELLLHENLSGSGAGAVVRSVARAHTLTVLRQVDVVGKGLVVEFLIEACLCIPVGEAECIVSLRDAELQGAILSGANLQGAELQGANLQKAGLFGARLQAVHLEGADLTEADLSCANLQGANLFGATLDRARLDFANLEGVFFKRASLKGARLRMARLRGATFVRAETKGADFSDAYFDGAIDLPDQLKPKG